MTTSVTEYIRGLVLVELTIHSEISLVSFRCAKKCEILPQFSTSVTFDTF